MNLADLKVALRRYGFDDTDPLTAWLNDALHEFEDAYEWPFFETDTTDTLDPGEATLVLPSDFFRVISLKLDTRSTDLTYNEIRKFEKDHADRTTPGVPCEYTLIGLETARFWPVPDSTETIRLVYRREVPDLVDPTDIPAIPARYHYPLVLGAAAKALQAENEEDRAETARNEFDAAIARAISKFSVHQEMSPDTVQDVMTWLG